MKLSEMATTLRETSGRYGGIQHYLEAAGALDKAVSEFFKDQDMTALRHLNTAFARAHRLTKELAAERASEAK